MANNSTQRKKNPNWGGARPNSGPKKQTLSGAQVAEMLKKARDYAKKYEKTIDEVILDIIYTTKSDKDKLAAIKLFKDFSMAKISEEGPTNQDLGPQIFLPEKRAEIVALPGGKDASQE